MGMGSEDGGNGKNEMRPKMQIKCDLAVMMIMRLRKRIETMIYVSRWVSFGVVLVGSWSRGYLGLILIVTRDLMGSEGRFHLQQPPAGARSQMTKG